MATLVILCSLAAWRGAEAAPGTDKAPDFTRDIRPILSHSCFARAWAAPNRHHLF